MSALSPLRCAGGLQQGVHQHLRRHDSRELPQEERAADQRRLPEVPRHRGLRHGGLPVLRAEDHALPLQVTGGMRHVRA